MQLAVESPNVLILHDESGTLSRSTAFSHCLLMVRSDRLFQAASEIARVRQQVGFPGTLKWNRCGDNSRNKGCRKFAEAVLKRYLSEPPLFAIKVSRFDRGHANWNERMYGGDFHVYNCTLRQAIVGLVRYAKPHLPNDEKIVCRVFSDDRGRVVDDDFESVVPASCEQRVYAAPVVFQRPVKLVSADGPVPISFKEVDLRELFAVVDFMGGLIGAAMSADAPRGVWKTEMVRQISDVIADVEDFEPSIYPHLKRSLCVSQCPGDDGLYSRKVKLPHRVFP